MCEEALAEVRKWKAKSRLYVLGDGLFRAAGRYIDDKDFKDQIPPILSNLGGHFPC